MANKNIDEILRRLHSIEDDAIRLPGRDSQGDLSFTVSQIWNRLVDKLSTMFISASNILMGTNDSKGKFNASNSIHTALETRAANDDLVSHTNSNYLTSDPHQIISNAELFRQSIDVMSKQEVNQAIKIGRASCRERV